MITLGVCGSSVFLYLGSHGAYRIVGMSDVLFLAMKTSGLPSIFLKLCMIIFVNSMKKLASLLLS